MIHYEQITWALFDLKDQLYGDYVGETVGHH